MTRIVAFAAFSTFALGIVMGQSMTGPVNPVLYRPVAETLSPLDMMRAAHELSVEIVDNAV